ncbi:4-hydroxythreonine-4-phosphate dehydrogenase PdxA [Roseivirga sp. BDSF3-8]|uniref:4-hydroxythreonine-4-phosphate dehydrogenase PdxA n=1 Tax=Roseivirga sp. BDSF3-8 TaxID=3241598 RepID=UPI0035323A41
MDKQNRLTHKPVIGISIGDINGIGPEIIIKALADTRLTQLITPVVYGSTKVLGYYKKAIDVQEFSYFQAKDPGSFNPKKVNVVNCWEELAEIDTGIESENGGKYAYLALEKAVKEMDEGHIEAVVTAPINKNVMQSDDFKFPGHTEYFAQRAGAADSLMFMVSGDLRVGVATGHIPLSAVPDRLTPEVLRSKLDMMLYSLKNDFGILKPKVAVLGLNPHAGEEGLLGTEDRDLITPVINSYKDKGHLVFGPYPADGFFGMGHFKKFDAVLAMYHDQGLVPFKTLSFGSGVNFTAGLSYVRTSPDHGTAYDIAGKNLASEESMLQAIFLAADIVKKRRGEGLFS